MTTALRVTGAYKKFGNTQALNGADVTVEAGQLLLLLGPNGAGKTTLVRSVAGRVRLDQGQIELFGQNLAEPNNTARQMLGVVPQEIALYPLLTSRENLEVFGSFHGLRGALLKERVAWALQWTGLGDRDNEPIKGFSGGMKRRLNIACAVLHQPQLVLLDEPTVGVDPQSRERIWEMLEKLKQSGTSLILTTHQLDEAQIYGDHIAIIDHGKTIATGTFNQLIETTIGAKRKITLTLDRPPEKPLDGFSLEFDGKAVRFQALDVAIELPPVLERLHSIGHRVEDVGVESPTLQMVFLHLTGRELRE